MQNNGGESRFARLLFSGLSRPFFMKMLTNNNLKASTATATTEEKLAEIEEGKNDENGENQAVKNNSALN